MRSDVVGSRDNASEHNELVKAVLARDVVRSDRAAQRACEIDGPVCPFREAKNYGRVDFRRRIRISTFSNTRHPCPEQSAPAPSALWNDVAADRGGLELDQAVACIIRIEQLDQRSAASQHCALLM